MYKSHLVKTSCQQQRECTDLFYTLFMTVIEFIINAMNIPLWVAQCCLQMWQNNQDNPGCLTNSMFKPDIYTKMSVCLSERADPQNDWQGCPHMVALHSNSRGSLVRWFKDHPWLAKMSTHGGNSGGSLVGWSRDHPRIDRDVHTWWLHILTQEDPLFGWSGDHPRIGKDVHTWWLHNITPEDP